MSLEHSDLLTKGRGDLNLPKFLDASKRKRYGWSALRTFDQWVYDFLQVNEVPFDGNRHHPHSVPNQLILPSTNDEPLLVISRSTEIEDKRSPTSVEYDMAFDVGMNMPTTYSRRIVDTRVSVPPKDVSVEFVDLFRSKTISTPFEERTSLMLGNEHEGYLDNHFTRDRRVSREGDERRQILVNEVMARLGYDDAGFGGSEAFRVEEYYQQLCEKLDPEL